MAEIIGGGWLRDDAAAQFNALQRAAKQRFGTFMPVTSAGRTKAEQARLYNGWIKRLPGFSPAYHPDSPYALHVVNGGSAVDVGGAFGVSGTAPHAWLKATAPAYGYAVNAVVGEPWHIQYTLKPSVLAGSTPIPIAQIPETKDQTMRYLHAAERNDAMVGEFGHYPAVNTEYAATERDIYGGGTVTTRQYDVARQAAINRRNELVAEIRSAVISSLPPLSVDLAGVVAAVRAAIAEQGVEVDLTQLEAKLDTEFAKLNANIDDQPTEFHITPKE